MNGDFAPILRSVPDGVNLWTIGQVCSYILHKINLTQLINTTQCISNNTPNVTYPVGVLNVCILVPKS